MNTKYEVKIGDGWWPCSSAKKLNSGWLHYQTFDGSIGLARPSKFRERSQSNNSPTAVDPSNSPTDPTQNRD